MHKTIIILFALLSVILSALAQAGTSTSSGLNYNSTARVQPQVIMSGVSPIIVDVGDTQFDVLALVRPGFYPLQNVNIGLGGGRFSGSLTHINTLANGDQFWKTSLVINPNAFGKSDFPLQWGTGAGQYFVRATDSNQQTVNNFPLIQFTSSPEVVVIVDTSMDSSLSYNSTKRYPAQIIMAGVSPAIVDIADTSFDIVGLVRPGANPIQNVVLTQGGNTLRPDGACCRVRNA